MTCERELGESTEKHLTRKVKVHVQNIHLSKGDNGLFRSCGGKTVLRKAFPMLVAEIYPKKLKMVLRISPSSVSHGSKYPNSIVNTGRHDTSENIQPHAGMVCIACTSLS